MTSSRTCTKYDRVESGERVSVRCGETLVDDETSPCAAKDVHEVLCRRKASSLYHEPDGGTGLAYHAYVASAYRCPVHGATKNE